MRLQSEVVRVMVKRVAAEDEAEEGGVEVEEGEGGGEGRGSRQSLEAQQTRTIRTMRVYLYVLRCGVSSGHFDRKKKKEGGWRVEEKEKESQSQGGRARERGWETILFLKTDFVGSPSFPLPTSPPSPPPFVSSSSYTSPSPPLAGYMLEGDLRQKNLAPRASRTEEDTFHRDRPSSFQKSSVD